MHIAATPAADEHRINERIRAREVRLVDPEGAQLGIKPLPEALTIAREMDLDLVEVAPLANPPVCRIMDYGKFKFDEAQRAKESRRKSTNVSLKEMKYRLKIGPGDFDTKTRKVGGFLTEGHKVKITIMFRGREVERPHLGKDILDRVADKVSAVGKVEMMPRLDGRNMVMVLSPDKRAQANASRQSPASHDGRAAGRPVAVANAPVADAPAPPANAAVADAPAPPANAAVAPAVTPPAAAPAPDAAESVPSDSIVADAAVTQPAVAAAPAPAQES